MYFFKERKPFFMTFRGHFSSPLKQKHNPPFYLTGPYYPPGPYIFCSLSQRIVLIGCITFMQFSSCKFSLGLGFYLNFFFFEWERSSQFNLLKINHVAHARAKTSKRGNQVGGEWCVFDINMYLFCRELGLLQCDT